MKTSPTVWGFTGMYLHSLSSFHFTCWIFTKKRSFSFSHTHTKKWISIEATSQRVRNTFFPHCFCPLQLVLSMAYTVKHWRFIKSSDLLVGRLTNQGILPHYFSEDQSHTGVIRRTTIIALILHHLKLFLFSPWKRKQKIQINILLVMNIQYTHPLSNEKRGQLNNTLFFLFIGTFLYKCIQSLRMRNWGIDWAWRRDPNALWDTKVRGQMMTHPRPPPVQSVRARTGRGQCVCWCWCVCRCVSAVFLLFCLFYRIS